MKLSFHGADRGVTGSCHLFEVAGKRLLIDCGMFQGGRELAAENSEPFGFDPARIDYVLQTHAHLDHCGRLPLLVKGGFRGEIICTGPTAALVEIVLADSARISAEDAARRVRRVTAADAMNDRGTRLRQWVLVAVLAVATGFTAVARAEWVSRTVDGTMGTRIQVELWSEDPVAGEQAIDAVMAEMTRIDLAMSTYKPASELSQLNAHAAEKPVKISVELFDLLTRAMEFSRITGGAFDVTYASVGFMYDFRAHKRPTEAQIKAALPEVNYRLVKLDAKTHTVRYLHKGVRIDLGGIAKGYAVDRGIAILQQRGIQHALVSAGGDSRVIGDRLGRPWIIAIRHPDRKDEIITRIPLVDTAISTSGDYERYYDEGGQRYHHIIDPRTGHSASAVRSATILADTATRTDGLSKTAFVLGAEKALEIYKKLGDVDAVIVTPDGKVHYSDGLEPGVVTAPPKP